MHVILAIAWIGSSFYFVFLDSSLVPPTAWLARRWFPGRAAFLRVGAMIATAMSANVSFWIIPGQRTTVADLMPRNNAPGITERERALIGQWFPDGAQVD